MIHQPSMTKLSSLIIGFGALLLSGLAQAAEDPTFKVGEAALVTPTAAWSYYNTNGGSTTRTDATPIDTRLVNFAAQLDNDADRIYDYVHDAIDVSFMFGLQKGATGALLEGYGTPFDQAHLMVELLRAAGYETKYVVGTITLTGAQIEDWIGTQNANAVKDIFADGGIPATVTGSGSSITSATLGHAWVRVKISGTFYDFDPSFKAHDEGAGLSGGLASAMNFTDASLMSSATSGATVTSTSVSNLNHSNITTKLDDYTDDLVTHIETNAASDSYEDIAGGRIIAAHDGTQLRQTSLPHEGSVWAQWTDEIPNVFRTKVSVDFKDTYVNYADVIWDKKLRYKYIVCTTPTIAVHYNFTVSDADEIDPALEDECPSYYPGAGTADDLTIDIDHPYAADSGAYMDEDVVVNNAWNGLHNTAMIALISFGDYRGGVSRYYGGRPCAEGIHCEAGTMDGSLSTFYSYLEQSSAARMRVDDVADTLTQHHHTIGMIFDVSGARVIPDCSSPCSTYGDGAPQIFDLATSISVNSESDTSAVRTGAIWTTTALANALEGSVLQQGGNTWGRADVPSFLSDESVVYLATSLSQFNSSIKPNLNYTDDIDAIEDLLNAGYDVIISKNDDLGDTTATEKLFRGKAFFGYDTANGLYRHLTVTENEAYGTSYRSKGAGGITTPEVYQPSGEVKPAEAQVWRGGIDINGQTGDVSYTPPADITVGQGSFPDSLAFQRVYKPGLEATYNVGDSAGKLTSNYRGGSSRAYGRAGGAGWTHNFFGKADISSSGMAVLGGNGARQSAAVLVAIEAATTIAENGQSLDRLLVMEDIVNWLAESFVLNSVAITIGGSSESFTKIPTGDYIPPEGSASSLSVTGTVTRGARLGGWDNHRDHLLDTNGQTVTYTTKSGEVLTFKNKITSFLANNPKPDVHNPGQEIGPTTLTGTRENVSLLLESWDFPKGVDVDFTYDAKGRLTKVTNTIGRELNFTGASGRGIAIVNDGLGNSVSYDANGDFTNLMGDKIEYTYDDCDALVEIISPLSAPDPKLELNYDTVTAYTGHTLQAQECRKKRGVPGKGFLSLEDATGEKWTYKISGRRAEIADPLGNASNTYYDYKGRPVKSVDAVGNESLTEYDGLGRVSKSTAPEDNYTLYAYDAKHNVISVKVYNKAGTSFLETTAVYDLTTATNELDSITNPRGETTNFAWVAGKGLLSTVTQQAAASGGTRPVTTYAYNSYGMVTSVTDPTGIKTCFAYDSANDYALDTITASCQTGGLSLVTSFTTNTRGDILTANGARTDVTDVTSYVYDDMRRVTEVTGADPDGGGSLAAPVTQYTYDDDGRPTHVKQATGDTGNPWATSQTFYNTRDLVTKVTDPQNYDTETFYDDAGRAIVTLDAAGRKMRTVYDAAGRTIKVIKAWAGLTDGTGATLDCAQMRTDTAADPSKLQQCYQEYTYTDNGQVATVKDANGNVTTYAYDGYDRLASTTFADSSVESYTYDANGNMLTKTGRDARIVSFYYDALDRLTDRTVPGAPTHSANGRTVSHDFTYDLAGRRLSATHDGVALALSYDDAGRLLSQTHGGALPVSYQYDAIGNVSKLTHPDGFDVDFIYDALNRVTQAKDGSRVLATVAYDQQSRRQSVTYDNGTSATYDFSLRGDLTDHDWNFAGTGDDADYTFTYNGVGQLLTESVSNADLRWLPGSNGVDSYAINNLNQYTSITPAGQSAATIVHDDNGNITTDHRGHTYTYDAENVLRSVAGLSAGTATYAYNADGTRRSKTYNSVTASYYYDGDQEIVEYQASSVERRYIRLPGSVDEAFLMIDYTVDAGCTNTSYANCEVWAHQNRLGTVVATSDDVGAVIDEYTYSPYGVSGGSTSGFPFRFTGQKVDTETGLYYYKARYYDPETGRFMQTDPIGYEDQMNLYAYVGNDPVNMFDPTGQVSEYTVNEETKTIEVVIPVEFSGDEISDKDKAGIKSDIEDRVSGTIEGGKYDGYTITATVEERSRGDRNTIVIVENESDVGRPDSTAEIGRRKVTLQLGPTDRRARAGHEFGHILGLNHGKIRQDGRDNIMNFGRGLNSKQLTTFLRCRCNKRQR